MTVGVPDSSLKDWLKGKDVKIATDEGEAIGLAAGYYLAKGEPATVFMGSDGFCNALNPLTSLIIPYKIPMNLVIGVRGDLPQHKVMGKNVKKIAKLINLKDYCKITWL